METYYLAEITKTDEFLIKIKGYKKALKKFNDNVSILKRDKWKSKLELRKYINEYDYIVKKSYQ